MHALRAADPSSSASASFMPNQGFRIQGLGVVCRKKHLPAQAKELSRVAINDTGIIKAGQICICRLELGDEMVDLGSHPWVVESE